MQAMPSESMGVGAKCQENTGECQWNLYEWAQSPRGMLGNAGECQGNVCEWVQTARGMQGMLGNARGTYWSGCIVPGECRVLPGDCKGVGVKS